MMQSERDRPVTSFTGAIATERLSGIDEQFMPLAYTLTGGPLHAEHHARIGTGRAAPSTALPLRVDH